MNREELKAMGLTDEQVDSVMKSYGKATNEIKGKADKVDALESQVADYQAQITERDGQLTELKKVDAEGLQAEINRLEEANITTATDYQTKLDKQSFDYKLEKALSDEGVYNARALKGLLDLESIKLDGNTLLGLEDQIKALRESDANQFKSKDDNLPGGLKGRKPNDPKVKGGGLKNPFSDDTFNLTEQGRLSVDDPELYKQLKAQAGK